MRITLTFTERQVAIMASIVSHFSSHAEDEDYEFTFDGEEVERHEVGELDSLLSRQRAALS